MKFIFPELPRGAKLSAVYKIIFDGGFFYIGSAINIKQRMNVWKFKMNAGEFKNYKVEEAFKNSQIITFEILEIVDDPVMRRFREDGYIKINFGKPLCLNIAPSAFTNTGVKQNPNKKKRPPNISQYKSVAKVDSIGQIIEIYESVKAACISNKTKAVSECFRNCFRKVKGMTFRELDKDGNIIPAKQPAPKLRKVRAKGYHISDEAKERLNSVRAKRKEEGTFKYPPHSKWVLKMDSEGKEVGRFPSIIEAAKNADCKDRKNFSKIVSGKRSNTGYYKGYVWKYA